VGLTLAAVSVAIVSTNSRETHYSDLATNFDIGVAGAIYAERRRSRLGFNEIWCMCRPAEFLQR
jgi:hypothetical protein